MVQNIEELKAQMIAEDPRMELAPEEERESKSNTWVTSWSDKRSGMDTYPIEEFVDDFHSITCVLLNQHGAETPVEVRVERGMLEVRARDGAIAVMQTGATNIAHLVVYARTPTPI